LRGRGSQQKQETETEKKEALSQAKVGKIKKKIVIARKGVGGERGQLPMRKATRENIKKKRRGAGWVSGVI